VVADQTPRLPTRAQQDRRRRPPVKRRFKVFDYPHRIFRDGVHYRGRPASAAEHEYDAEAVLFEGHSMLLALRRLLLQGALRVALVAVTTAGVVGFMSIVAASSQAPEPALTNAKMSSRACVPSPCRAKAETATRDNKR